MIAMVTAAAVAAEAGTALRPLAEGEGKTGMIAMVTAAAVAVEAGTALRLHEEGKKYHFYPLYHFAPVSFCPWKLFNDLRYLPPMSRIILPPGFILPPYHFGPFQQKLMTGAHPVTVAPLVLKSH